MRILGALMVLALATLPVGGKEVIRSLRVLDAACKENRCGIPFEIKGIVVIPTTVPQGNFMILSGNDLLPIVDMRTNLTERAAFGIRMGDRVAVCGRTEPYLPECKTTANCHDLQVLSSGPLPNTTPMSLHDFLADNGNSCRITAIRGTLQDVFPDDIDVHFICAVLNDGPNSVNLICNCPRSWLSDFRTILGCEVIATGIAIRDEDIKSRYHGSRLRIAGTNAFRIVSRPFGYPFNVMEFAPDKVTDPKALAKLGPQIVRGTVLAVWGRESFLLKTDAGRSVRIDISEGPLPQVRTAVETVGIVETDLCDITLSRASWRPIAAAATDDGLAEQSSLDRLFTTGRSHYASINVRMHGRILTIRGTIKNISNEEDGSRKLLLADGDHTILVVCGPGAHGDPPPKEGWQIAVTGVCIRDSDVWRPTVPIPKIRGLFLVTRSNDDIVILEKSTWWTPVRLAIAIAVLLAFLVAVFIWNVSLRILVTRRSREVIKAQTSKIESELRIDERTRLAAELHDNTVQNLTAIAYRITAAQGALKDQESEAGRILQVAAKMLKSCRTSLRQCLWDLRNDALDEPDFGTAIRRTVETVSGDAKLSIRFAGRRDLVNDTTAHAILNIMRELVSNATIHGRADSIVIAGEAHPGAITFSVRDNGTGFDTAHRPGQDDGHFGLDGIQERLEQLGGTITIDSTLGKGTYIRINLQSAESSTTGDNS